MKLKAFGAALMMIVSILVVCVVVPAGFILADPFSKWLGRIGVHASPNLADGYEIAAFTMGKPMITSVPPGFRDADVVRALSLRRFAVKKVEFRRWSGMGIEPRLNLCFEFAGRLPDPHNSSRKFSMTAIHVYIKAPGKPATPASSDKTAAFDPSGVEWNYQVIIDGFHEQARIFDERGSLVARGLGMYVDSPNAGKGDSNSGGPTKITAALPLAQLGDPSAGEWTYYVLVGLVDSSRTSMMLHSGRNDTLGAFGGAIDDRTDSAGDSKPRLRPLSVSNRI